MWTKWRLVAGVWIWWDGWCVDKVGWLVCGYGGMAGVWIWWYGGCGYGGTVGGRYGRTVFLTSAKRLRVVVEGCGRWLWLGVVVMT